MKFLVPNYSCLQNPWLRGHRPHIPVLSCPLSSTEFVETPHEKNSWVRHCPGLRRRAYQTPLQTHFRETGPHPSKHSTTDIRWHQPGKNSAETERGLWRKAGSRQCSDGSIQTSWNTQRLLYSASFLVGGGPGGAGRLGVVKWRGVGVCPFACNFNVARLTVLPETEGRH